MGSRTLPVGQTEVSTDLPVSTVHASTLVATLIAAAPNCILPNSDCRWHSTAKTARVADQALEAAKFFYAQGNIQLGEPVSQLFDDQHNALCMGQSCIGVSLDHVLYRKSADAGGTLYAKPIDGGSELSLLRSIENVERLTDHAGTLTDFAAVGICRDLTPSALMTSRQGIRNLKATHERYNTCLCLYIHADVGIICINRNGSGEIAISLTHVQKPPPQEWQVLDLTVGDRISIVGLNMQKAVLAAYSPERCRGEIALITLSANKIETVESLGAEWEGDACPYESVGALTRGIAAATDFFPGFVIFHAHTDRVTRFTKVLVTHEPIDINDVHSVVMTTNRDDMVALYTQYEGARGYHSTVRIYIVVDTVFLVGKVDVPDCWDIFWTSAYIVITRHPPYPPDVALPTTLVRLTDRNDAAGLA